MYGKISYWNVLSVIWLKSCGVDADPKDEFAKSWWDDLDLMGDFSKSYLDDVDPTGDFAKSWSNDLAPIGDFEKLDVGDTRGENLDGVTKGENPDGDTRGEIFDTDSEEGLFNSNDLEGDFTLKFALPRFLEFFSVHLDCLAVFGIILSLRAKESISSVKDFFDNL